MGTNTGFLRSLWVQAGQMRGLVVTLVVLDLLSWFWPTPWLFNALIAQFVGSGPRILCDCSSDLITSYLQVYWFSVALVNNTVGVLLAAYFAHRQTRALPEALATGRDG
jgi:hypothetical protein